MDILNRIIDLLISQGKEQQHLADYLGLKKSVVTDWKNNKSHSYTKYLTQIASFFNVPVNAFYCDYEEFLQYRNLNLTSSKTEISDFDKAYPKNSDTTANELLQAYCALSLKDKAKALTYVCQLAENQETEN